MAATTYADIALAIGQQVEQKIAKAKSESESKVSEDFRTTRALLQNMEANIQDLTQRVGRYRRGGPNGEALKTVDHDFLEEKIGQLEVKWSAEVRALKEDLHKTISAHNHNSDLMRHQRDALDSTRRELDVHLPVPDQIDRHLETVDELLQRGQEKQNYLEGITQMLSFLETKADGYFGPQIPATAAAAQLPANATAAGGGSFSGSFNVNAEAFVPQASPAAAAAAGAPAPPAATPASTPAAATAAVPAPAPPSKTPPPPSMPPPPAPVVSDAQLDDAGGAAAEGDEEAAEGGGESKDA